MSAAMTMLGATLIIIGGAMYLLSPRAERRRERAMDASAISSGSGPYDWEQAADEGRQVVEWGLIGEGPFTLMSGDTLTMESAVMFGDQPRLPWWSDPNADPLGDVVRVIDNATRVGRVFTAEVIATPVHDAPMATSPDSMRWTPDDGDAELVAWGELLARRPKTRAPRVMRR